jgi:conjugal transfer pilus assembly protein TraW
MLAKLKEKEKSGELDRLQQEAIRRSQKSAEEPRPVTGIARTVMPRKFYWNPTISAPQDVRDMSGNLVVTKGQRVNPLDYVNLPQNLLFFDARDQEQLVKARQLMQAYAGQVKPIMTGGNVREVTKAWQTQVYFDQGGVLIRKFGIKQVPAMVSQEGKRLRIDELTLK